MEQTDKNKTLIRDVYKKIIGERDTTLVHKIVAEDYIQHNPMVKTGRTGLLESLEMLKKFPKPDSDHKPFVRIFAEDDYVVVHTLVDIFGTKKMLVDLFRIEAGIIREHWDAIEDVFSDIGINGNSVIGGPVQIEDIHLTAINRALVGEYHHTVVCDRIFEMIDAFVAADVIQHQPQVANGMKALADYLHTCIIENTFRIIGEGNFVLAQSKGTIDNSAYVFYDIYRIAAGKIAEHWCVKQMIPKVMAHDNGMI